MLNFTTMVEGSPDISWWQRVNQRVAASRVGSWIYSYTLHHIDSFLRRISGGRITVPQVLAGLPVIWLTTIGAKTGKKRTVPVLGLRDGEKWVVIASNWGKEHHPAWYHNLRANPETEVTYQNQTQNYVAREANEEEWQNYWNQATDLYVGFEPYQRRSGDRQIPIVVLEPRSNATE